jgi:hypothetical protein
VYRPFIETNKRKNASRKDDDGNDDDDNDSDDDDDDDNGDDGTKRRAGRKKPRSDWEPKRCKLELGFANKHLHRNYARWRAGCLAHAHTLGIRDKSGAGDALWRQLKDHARTLSGFRWSPAGAEWVDPNLTDEHRTSISKAVTDLLKDVLKDVLKKWHQQEKECQEEARAAGVDVVNAGIKPPPKKKSKSSAFNRFI